VFGSIGLPELIMILAVALLLFGPRKLPEIGRTIGKALGEFRRASNDLKRTIEEEVATDDLRQVGREVREATSLATVFPPLPVEEPAPPPAPAHPAAAAEAMPGESSDVSPKEPT
jgi:TatA/E family protein of Tat protein translocase